MADKPQYQRCRTIGAGAFAQVSLLKNINTNSYTALKSIDRKKLKTRDLCLIMNEIVILKSLDNIFINKMKNNVDAVKCIDILLEFESGGDLHTVFTIIKNENISEKEALFYIAEISLGVEYLHLREVIHRDLKLENILVSGTGHIKICDFGFACIANRCIEVCGTIGYLCPEIIQNLPYTNKVDIWCIGVMAYTLVYGRNPFEDDPNDLEKTYRKTLAFRYTTDATKLYINDFLEDIFVGEEKRLSISDTIRSPWLQSINIYKLRKGIYTGDVPYIPEEKYQNPQKRLNFINKLIAQSNEYVPVVVFDTKDNFKCIGYNTYFKTIFHITKEDVFLSDLLNASSGGGVSKCIQKIKSFLEHECNSRFLHTKHLRRQDNNKKIKCGVDTTIVLDEVGDKLLFTKIVPIDLV